MPQTDLLPRTFAFACRAIDLYRHLVKRGGPGRALAPQFLYAATSIGANEEEAQAAASRADFSAKQSIVLRERLLTSEFWIPNSEKRGDFPIPFLPRLVFEV